MAPKCKTSAGDASTAKRQKKVMSLSHKVDLLDQLVRGQSTVHYIQKNEKASRESVVASTVPSTKVVTHAQDDHMERMEKVLRVWIENNAQKNMSKLASHSHKDDAYVRTSDLQLHKHE